MFVLRAVETHLVAIASQRRFNKVYRREKFVCADKKQKSRREWKQNSAHSTPDCLLRVTFVKTKRLVSVVEVGREERTKNLEAEITFTFFEKNQTSGRARRIPRKTSSDSKNKKKTSQWEISFVFMFFLGAGNCTPNDHVPGARQTPIRSSSETKKISTLSFRDRLAHRHRFFLGKLFTAAFRRLWEDKTWRVSRVLTVYEKTYCFWKCDWQIYRSRWKSGEKTSDVSKVERLSDFCLGK